MRAGDLLRLAWEAEHDGRTRLRDALLTLAVIESGPDDSWAERCRTSLVADRPDHFLRQFPTVRSAIGDPRVVEARERLRVKYPSARVRSLLLRAGARRGPFLGRVESLDAMIEDLAGPSAEAENVRRDAPQPSRGPLTLRRVAQPMVWSLAFPTMKSGPDRWGEGRLPDEAPIEEVDPEPDREEFVCYYVSALLAIAFLLASVGERP